jgi:hypothetical protein
MKFEDFQLGFAIFAFGFALAILLVQVLLAFGAGDLPEAMTPGLANPALTKEVICRPGWSTSEVRDVTELEKQQVYSAYHMRPNQPPCPCEIDHLIPLELGGSNDKRNLWPQSYVTEPWNAHVKDELENRMHEEVCAGDLGLAEAQREIAKDWIAAFRKRFVHP